MAINIIDETQNSTSYSLDSIPTGGSVVAVRLFCFVVEILAAES